MRTFLTRFKASDSLAKATTLEEATLVAFLGIIACTGTMSPSVDTAQSQWLEQLAAMRAAIAELKLPQSSDQADIYGHDIVIDDDDLSGTASGDDIWDLISDTEDEEYSSDQLDGSDVPYMDGFPDGRAYDQEWLRKRCQAAAQHASGLDAQALQEQVSAVLASDSNSEHYHLLKLSNDANDKNR